MKLTMQQAAGVAAAGVVIAAVAYASAGASSPDRTDAGTLTCTTDGSGQCPNQPHGLGAVPSAVVVTPKAPLGGANTVESMGADQFTVTTFRVRAFKPNGSALTNVTITFSYAAFAGPSPTPTPSPTLSTSPTPTTTPTVTQSPTPTATATPTPTVTPTITPTPTATTTAPAGACAPNPSSCGYPDSTNTGSPAGTLLRVPQDVSFGPGWHYDSRGWVTIDGNGAVFSGFQVGVNVDVTASNVTVSNNRIILNGGSWGVSLRHTSNVTISGNTIAGTNKTSGRCDNAIRGIYGDDDGVRILGNDISMCASGINHLDRGGLIEDNYIHDLGFLNGDHINGIQLGSGSGPLMTIRHNTIFNEYSQTDCVMLANDDGAQTNRTVTGNLLAGGGYTLYGAGGPSGSATNIVVTGNRFSRLYYPNGGYWGPVAYWMNQSGNVWSGNTWDGTATPVNP